MTGIKIGAIFVGWITSLFLLFIEGILIFIFVLRESNVGSLESSMLLGSQPVSFYITIFALTLLTFFVGGYVSGRMAAISGALNGAMVVATMLLSVFFLGMFTLIVGKNLGVDVLSFTLEMLSPIKLLLFLVLALSTLVSVLGGIYGEGYIDRLFETPKDSKSNENASGISQTIISAQNSSAAQPSDVVHRQAS